jgi:hypothetical protein
MEEEDFASLVKRFDKDGNSVFDLVAPLPNCVRCRNCCPLSPSGACVAATLARSVPPARHLLQAEFDEMIRHVLRLPESSGPATPAAWSDLSQGAAGAVLTLLHRAQRLFLSEGRKWAEFSW